MARKRETFTEQMRRLFLESGCTHAELRKATGIDRAIISRFASGKLLMNEKNLNLMAEYLGWEIKKRKG